mmetsp:Transcript_22016/g.63485  ORF Transcript_22016/g.63485 Transcript_22016/m.63485 type:complete len:212 (-) Transcript_22016:493-1128(-)
MSSAPPAGARAGSRSSSSKKESRSSAIARGGGSSHRPSSSGSGASGCSGVPWDWASGSEAASGRGASSGSGGSFSAEGSSIALICRTSRAWRFLRFWPHLENTIQSIHLGRVLIFCLSLLLAALALLTVLWLFMLLPSSRPSICSCLFIMYSYVVSCCDMRKACRSTSCRSRTKSGRFTTVSAPTMPSSSCLGAPGKTPRALSSNASSSMM